MAPYRSDPNAYRFCVGARGAAVAFAQSRRMRSNPIPAARREGCRPRGRKLKVQDPGITLVDAAGCHRYRHGAAVVCMRRMSSIVELDTRSPIWSRFFTVAPLIVVGTLEADGSLDFAPKHMAMPLGWQNYFCFVCSPRHATQRNAQARGQFTVSFPRPDQFIQSSLLASGRAQDGSKPAAAAVPAMPARVVEGALVRDAYLWLECALERVVDGFGENSLIVGEIVAASVDERALRASEADDADLTSAMPLLVYVSPRRFAEISETFSFPFPADFRL